MEKVKINDEETALTYEELLKYREKLKAEIFRLEAERKAKAAAELSAKRNTQKVLEILKEFSCVVFEYKGKPCGIDPYSNHDYLMWYGDNEHYARSIDDVLNAKLFDNKTLQEIAGEIKIV